MDAFLYGRLLVRGVCGRVRGISLARERRLGVGVGFLRCVHVHTHNCGVWTRNTPFGENGRKIRTTGAALTRRLFYFRYLFLFLT